METFYPVYGKNFTFRSPIQLILKGKKQQQKLKSYKCKVFFITLPLYPRHTCQCQPQKLQQLADANSALHTLEKATKKTQKEMLHMIRFTEM